MEGRRESYWLFVLVGGLIAGVVAGVLFTVLMALTNQRNIVRVFFAGGLFYTAFMIPMFMLLYGIMYWTIRREVPVADPATAHDRVATAATKLKFRLVAQGDGYYRFQPRTGLLKPKCSQVEVWLTSQQLILLGPGAFVKRLVKQLKPSGM